AVATCPKCVQSFKAIDPDEEPVVDFKALRARKQAEEAEEEAHEPSIAHPDTEMPPWVNPWGLAAVGAAALALLQGTLIGIRSLTIILTVLGGVLIYLGVRSMQENRKVRDQAWFYTAGSVNAIVLLLTLFFPGLINSWWVLDTRVAPPDPNKLVV